jgi:hypothetical protein
MQTILWIIAAIGVIVLFAMSWVIKVDDEDDF